MFTLFSMPRNTPVGGMHYVYFAFHFALYLQLIISIFTHSTFPNDQKIPVQSQLLHTHATYVLHILHIVPW